MWAIALAIAAVLLWALLRRKKSAPAKQGDPRRVIGVPAQGLTTEENSGTATPDAKWRQLNREALRLAANGDWDAYACALQDQGDQLTEEGRAARAFERLGLAKHKEPPQRCSPIAAQPAKWPPPKNCSARRYATNSRT